MNLKPKRRGSFHPKPKSPAEKLRSLRYLLRQMRSAGTAWSDGQNIWTGQDFRDLKAKVVNMAIGIKAGQAEPRSAMAWNNLTVMLDLKDRAMIRAGTAANEARLQAQLVDLVRDGCRDKTINSRDRRKLALRILKRHFPDGYKGLAIPLRHDGFEREAIIENMRRCGLSLDRDYEPRGGLSITQGFVPDGLILKAGTPVCVDDEGYMTAETDGFTFPVPEKLVVKGKDPMKAPMLEPENFREP